MKKILRVFTLMLTFALTLGLLASCTESAKDDASKPDDNSTDVSTDVPVVSVDSEAVSSQTGSDEPDPVGENGDATARLDKIEIKDIDNDGVIRVACLGDSITAGDNGSNWPLFLSAALDYLGTVDGNRYEVHNHGKGGAAVHHVEEPIGDLGWGWGTVIDEDNDGKAYFYYDDKAFRAVWDYTPDVVLIQFGTNDALGDYGSYMKEDYYTYLVKPFLDKGAQIVMATPTFACNGMHDGSVNGGLHDFEVAMAKEWGFPLIDLNRILWGKNEVFKDGLHGNATGYNMMAQTYYKLVFGGELITATFETQPGATVRVIDKADNANYIRVADENGVASLDFIPSREYEFTVNIDLDGFKSVRSTASMSESATFKFEMEAGGMNIAHNGTGIACDSELYDAAKVPAALIDGDRTDGGYQTKNYKNGDWCGVTLDKAYTVEKIVFYWETAAYVSSFEDGGYDIEYKQEGSDDWKKLDQKKTSSERLAFSGDVVSDEIKPDPAITVTAVRVIFRDGKITDHKYAPKLYELEIYG